MFLRLIIQSIKNYSRMPLWTVNCWVSGHSGIIIMVIFQALLPFTDKNSTDEVPITKTLDAAFPAENPPPKQQTELEGSFGNSSHIPSNLNSTGLSQACSKTWTHASHTSDLFQQGKPSALKCNWVWKLRSLGPWATQKKVKLFSDFLL